MRQIKNTILTIMAVVAVVTQLVSQACTLTAPANLTVNSTPGICGANVTMASAVAGTACTSFTDATLFLQDFSSCSQGTWTTSFTGGGGNTGVTTCGAALFSFGCTANTNFTGTSPAAAGFVGCRAHINDDDAGSAFVGTGIITSPVIGVAPVAGKIYELRFGYEFVDLGGASFSVEVGSGATWTQVFTTAVSASGAVAINITAQMASNLQVRFVHADGGSWAWGVAAAPGAGRVSARQRDQRHLPQPLDDPAPLRVAGNARLVGDALARQRAGDRAVDHLARLPRAVVAVIDQRSRPRRQLRLAEGVGDGDRRFR